MEKGRIDIVTLGCSKNLVDSQRLMRRLQERGYTLYHDSRDVCGEIVVVNTCGFIGDAKEESIEMILSLARAKEEERIGKLYVMGCLSERYLSELRETIPEVDEFFGKFNWDAIVDMLPPLKTPAPLRDWERTLTGSPFSAYIKISEGCNRFCAYCAIPLITGRHKSRPVEEIVEETRQLAARGVKEFNVIAQDLSAYGTDLYGQSALARLVDAMADVEGVHWIRLHYAYPVDFPFDVLEVMRRRPNVCNYLDIALQHISDPVLKNMRRHIDKARTLSLIERIRHEVPGICLRTTLMTGFPGEGEEEFRELKEFVSSTRFERMGAFAYCEEEGTWGARHLKDAIPQEIKEARRDAILRIQREISEEHNQSLIGSTVEVLCDRIEDRELVCRTQWDSPEVDNEVRVPFAGRAPHRPGDFFNVEITEAYEYDLTGRLV